MGNTAGAAILMGCQEPSANQACCKARAISVDFLDEIICRKKIPEAHEARELRDLRGSPGVLDQLIEELFNLHDLNDNGLLEEHELILLNQMIAIMHHGAGANMHEVEAHFAELFRSKFDPDGKPIALDTFRSYTLCLLDGYDRSPQAQEMILEQFVAEAQLGRTVCQEVKEMSAAAEMDIPCEYAVFAKGTSDSPELENLNISWATWL